MLVGVVALAGEAAGLLAGGGGAAELPVLVDGVDDPVDPGVGPDGLLRGVDKDDLVELVGRILVNPVAVEDAEVAGNLMIDKEKNQDEMDQVLKTWFERLKA